MVTQIVDDPLTTVKIPATARRRRKLPPMDPRRAPEDVLSGPLYELPPGPQVATDPAVVDFAPPLKAATGVTAGVAVIRAALRTTPATPGVYRMLDRKGDALYVGKARSLRSRVQNYTHPAALSNRLRRMVAETASMEIVSTHTEAEALLLEANLIKRLKRRYNILLRDDKSYPWLVLTERHDYPRISKHRGAQDQKNTY